MKTLLAAVTISALSLAALAVPATVILSVPSMDCAACPITVKKALTAVKGVSKAGPGQRPLQHGRTCRMSACMGMLAQVPVQRTGRHGA